jgi:hypothetical protein
MSSENIPHERWIILGLHLLIYVSLLLGYWGYVSAVFEYMGFANDFSGLKVVVGGLVAMVMAIALPTKRTPSSFFLHFILATAVTPALVFMAGADAPWEYGFLTATAFLLVTCVALVPLNIPLPRPFVTASFLLVLLSSCAVSVVLLVGVTGGYKYLNFDLSSVYEFRRAASEASLPIFAYIVPATTKAIIPLGIVLAIVQRRYLLIALFFVCSVLLGAMTNHRAPFFYPIVTLAMFVLATRPQPITWLLALLFGLVGAGIFDGVVINPDGDNYTPWFATLGLRRTFMVPALLNANYLEYFSLSPKLFWADSILTLGLVDNPHGLSAARLIGVEYFGGQETNANVGWIGSGIAQAGYWGLAIYSLGLGLVLQLGDRYAHRLGFGVILALWVVPVWTAALSSDFPTLFLTHGFIVLLLLASAVSLIDPLNTSARRSVPVSA